MHILYIHQHFATPRGSIGTRSYEFARRWVKAGHKVTLITGNCDVGGLQAGTRLVQRQMIDGINVVLTGIRYSNKQSFFRRMVSFLCFMLLGSWVGMAQKGVDVVYATSTPLTVGIPAMMIKWIKRIPFIFEVRDQWPEAPIEMGIIKNRIMTKVLLWLERVIYKQSAAIVALSPGQADGVRKVSTREKPVTVIPNSCDTDVFQPDIDGSAIRQRMGWQDNFVFLHAGAMGRVNSLGFIIEVASRLTNRPEILFVLLGEGDQKPTLQSRVRQLELANVQILPAVPKGQLAEVFAAVDVGLVTISNFAILQHNSANKFFDSLSAGKPVLLNYSGWQREVLEENAAGFGCKLYDMDEFIEKVLYLNSHRVKVLEMGRNARRLAEKQFDRDKMAMQALELIMSVQARP